LLQEAVSLSRNQHARSLELRATTDLASVWSNQNRRQEALEILAPIYASFDEGLETADLRSARALLDHLRR